MKKYDMVIYGATGFTGQYVVEELARVAEKEKSSGDPLKWAIAGRNKEKLLASLTEAKLQTGLSLDNIDIVLADNTDDGSLHRMASQAKCVINCVGPYQLYGEAVVKACIENGANHVDISGEPQFLESMQLKYDKAAEEAGVHIVGACGLDSVPADVGVCHLAKHFPGRLNSVEAYLRIKSGRGSSIHTGTMESASLFLANGSQIQEIRNQLYPEKLPKPKYRKEKRGVIHKNDELDLWALHLPSDEGQIYRSQRYLQENEGKTAVQFQGFIAFRSLWVTLGLTFGVGYFFLMSFFRWTRYLLFKFPEIMTAGTFTRKGPQREVLKKTTFSQTLIGKGWSEKLANENDEYSTPPDTKMKLTVSGPDPGYAATSLIMVACAMTILREKEKCLRSGGVMMPGAVYYNTNIVERMTQQGLTFDLQKN